jgi:N-formylglutamate amidohydrolase
MPHREAACIAAELNPPFAIIGAQHQTVPFIFNSPHSGRVYPSVLLEASRLTPHALRKSEDSYVEELFSACIWQGGVLMHALFPRAYLDINREPYELDPVLFKGTLPPFANSQSLRAMGGLGTIARIVNEKEEIYRKPLPVEAGLVRIDRLYKPYHAALARLLESTLGRFGVAFLIDCHSMPSQDVDRGAPWCDFVLGDRFGTSCAPEVTHAAESVLKGMGYKVALNKPYAGGFITEHYGRPDRGIHALQIEIDRSLYMNEVTFERLPSFRSVQRDLARLTQMMASDLPLLVGGYRTAAE